MLFANFAEAMAEARGKAQADTLRKTKTGRHREAPDCAAASIEDVPASTLRVGRRRDLRRRRYSFPATAK